MQLEVNFSTSNSELAVGFESVNNVSDGGYEKGYEQGYDDGYKEADSNSYYDSFWDTFQNYGERTDYRYAFFSEGSGWNSNIFKPKYDIVPTNLTYAFCKFPACDLSQILEECGVILDTSKCTAFTYAFQKSSITKIPPIDLSSATGQLMGVFQASGFVELTINNLQASCSFNNFITGDEKLVDLVITGTIGGNGLVLTTLTALSHDSILNILNILEDKTEDTSGTTWKITLGSTNKSKLTDEELQIAYDKGWEVA